MNGSLEEWASENSGCDMARLDEAVARGIARAKNDRLDKKKIGQTAAAAAVVLLIMVNSLGGWQLHEKTRDAFVSSSKVSEESAKILYDSISTGALLILENIQ